MSEEASTSTRRQSSHHLPGPEHPPKVNYFLLTLTVPAYPHKVKYFCIRIMMLVVNQAAGKLQDHHHQSLVVLQQRPCAHPSLKLQ